MVFDILSTEKKRYEKLLKMKKNKVCLEEMKNYNKYINLIHDFTRYCDRLPVIGFNSQRKYLPSSLDRLDKLPNLVICKNNSYMALGTNRLKYLDLTNYLAAGTSLSSFYKAYNVSDPRGFFYYKWFDSLIKLDCAELPPKS